MMSWYILDYYKSIVKVQTYEVENIKHVFKLSRENVTDWLAPEVSPSALYGAKFKHRSFHHFNKNSQKVMSMLWDPLIRLTDDVIKNEFHSMKDKMRHGFTVVHLGAGAQIIYKLEQREIPVLEKEEKVKQKIRNLQDRLHHRLVTLLNLSREINSTLIILLDPHTDLHPVYFKNLDPPNFNITSLSKWAISVASKYPDVIIWDSHLHVTNIYRQLCRTSCANLGKWEWQECKDIVHPSKLVMRHYATMLMNFICLSLMKH